MPLQDDQRDSGFHVHHEEVTYALKDNDEDPYRVMVKRWKEGALRLFVLVSFVALGL